jgi:3-isopropylmalate/(R)-2-methylmalate dehydratase small subunit
LVEREPTAQVTVDLAERQVRTGGSSWAFPLDDFSRWRLIEGLDDIGLTLRHEPAIGEFERHRSPYLPLVV